MKQVVHVVNLGSLEADLIVDDLHEAHQPPNVHVALDAGAVLVSQQILELVHVDRVPLVRNDVPQEFGTGRGALDVGAGDEVADPVDDTLVQIHAVVIHHPPKHVGSHRLVVPRGLVPGVPPGDAPGEKLVVEHVGEGPVTKVVAQPRELHRHAIRARQRAPDVARRPRPERVEHVRGEVRRPERVLEPVVRRPGEHVVRRPQLLELAQALHLRGVNRVDDDAGEIHVPVHRIVYDLTLSSRRPPPARVLHVVRSLRGKHRLLVLQLGHGHEFIDVLVELIGVAPLTPRRPLNVVSASPTAAPVRPSAIVRAVHGRRVHAVVGHIVVVGGPQAIVQHRVFVFEGHGVHVAHLRVGALGHALDVLLLVHFEVTQEVGGPHL
mmetsp:Transcript_6382/g.26470  ORF Transcript_6382/g.26470 Transcript_6382/m.26470 type:complete len:380 (+) Transcript_6382:678-1817(+)